MDRLQDSTIFFLLPSLFFPRVTSSVFVSYFYFVSWGRYAAEGETSILVVSGRRVSDDWDHLSDCHLRPSCEITSPHAMNGENVTCERVVRLARLEGNNFPRGCAFGGRRQRKLTGVPDEAETVKSRLVKPRGR